MIATQLIKQTLESLQMSTDLHLTYKNEEYTLGRRNSPYKSRHTFKLSRPGHHKDNLLILANGRVTLIVALNMYKVDNALMQYLPVFILEPLLNEFILPIHPHWAKASNYYAYYYVANQFTGYDDEGIPIFDRTIQPTIGNEMYHTVDGWVERENEKLIIS